MSIKFKNAYFFWGLVLVQLLTSYYSQTFLLTDNLYRSLIGNQMNERQFEDYLSFLHKWQWVSYSLIPIVLLIRISFVWISLKAGSFITERFKDTSFWKICIEAEIIFSVGTVAALLFTEFFIHVETMEDLSINPFSLQIFTSAIMPKWSSYFFNTINIFELGYVLFLAYLIAEESKKGFMPSLKFIATTYLPGLALWVLLVSYLSVVFQP